MKINIRIRATAKSNYEPTMEVDAKYEEFDTPTVQRYGRKLMAALGADKDVGEKNMMFIDMLPERRRRMKNTNALAELAERLTPKEVLNIEGKAVARDVDFDALVKAQRIVAELAKVENPIVLRTVGMTHIADILEADKNRAVEIVRNCRMIAMEGAGDGK